MFTLFQESCLFGFWVFGRGGGVICREWHNGIGWYIVARRPLILE